MKHITIDKDVLITFIYDNKSYKEISIILNCSVSTIKRRVKEYDIQYSKSRLYTEDQLKTLEYLVIKGNSFKEITIIFNNKYNETKTESAIHNICNKNGWTSLNHKKKSLICLTLELFDINPDILILEESELVNTKTKIKVKCLICNNIWETIPNTLLLNHGCPNCAKLKNKGSYFNISESEAALLDYPYYLYHVKLQYKDEIFYKFGVTTRENKARFNEYKPYKVIEEVSWIKLDAWTAICEEKKLINNYKPKYKFGGWNECYI